MIRSLSVLVALAAVGACVLLPVGLSVRQQRQTRNLRVVREGVLYRSGQMTIAGIQRVVHDRHIRTVVNLREGNEAHDRAEEDYCRRQGIGFIRLKPKEWGGGAGKAEVDDNVRTFLEVMRDPANHPVLVHCFAGIHRTGAYCALYRMDCEDWSNEKAIAEIKAAGYHILDQHEDMRSYLLGYRKGLLFACGDGGSISSSHGIAGHLTADKQQLSAGKIEIGMSWEETWP